MINKLIPFIFFLIFSIIFLIETYSFPAAAGEDVGSAMWPRILIYILIGLSIIYLLFTLKNNKQVTDETEEESEEVQVGIKKENLPKVLLGITAVILFAVLFETIGYLFSIFFLYIILSVIMFGKQFRKQIKMVLLQALLMVGIMYLIFPTMLNVRLPSGIFF